MTDTEPNFYLECETQIIEGIIKYGAFAERLDKNHVVIGTRYYMNNFKISETGDTITDPALTILFDKELGIARITEFYNDNPNASLFNGGNISKVAFNCIENSKETEEEKELNDYLNQWLLEVTKNRRENKNYFTKIYNTDL